MNATEAKHVLSKGDEVYFEPFKGDTGVVSEVYRDGLQIVWRDGNIPVDYNFDRMSRIERLNPQKPKGEK